jgi:tetrapyrrole methylase family protein/MazG family protein
LLKFSQYNTMPTQPEAEPSVKSFQQLEALVKRLRSEQGCPWDQQQTTASLKKYILEEAAELAEAIDRGDEQHICEEAGDLYFVLTLLLVICEEKGGCSVADALNAVCEKMLRRHPHVFAADDQVMPSEEQLKTQWERIKQEEKRR